MSSALCWLAGILLAFATPLAAQQPGSPLTVEQIFDGGYFRGAYVPSPVWLPDARGYLELRAARGGGTDIVRVDVATGSATTVVDASALVDETGKRISGEDITLSADGTRALVYHNSVTVWRLNTKGIYHVVDLTTKRVYPVSRRPGLQMFAKFSPSGDMVGFVRDNNIFVSTPATGREAQLTSDGSKDIINGTTDWVYEEEFDLRDGFRWSPDGRRIAFWHFDQSGIGMVPIVDEMAVYPTVSEMRYPKAGSANSVVRIGVVGVGANGTRQGGVHWIDIGGEGEQYVPRMEWLTADSVVFQRLPRRQNRVDVIVASAASGAGRTLLTDRDSAYVDVNDQPIWINNHTQFLWLSDETGWRQLFLYNRDGTRVRQMTANGVDVLSVEGVDSANGSVYVQEAAPTPTQKQIYRYSLRTAAVGERMTVAPGTHDPIIAPDGHVMLDFHTTATQPSVVTLYDLPSMQLVRTVEANTGLRDRLGALGVRGPEFFQIPMPDGTMLDAYRIVPPDFTPTRRYPVLMYAYGGPANPTVVDAYGGTFYLWSLMLAQQGYVVVSVDNRGAAWRGRDFRKATQGKLGVLESQDQMDAAHWLDGQTWVDSSRIGMWGWSYGAYLTTVTTARGGALFRAGIAVAPVTDWRLYDTIYTERYMGLPQENAGGYAASSPFAYLSNLQATLLLVHGLSDDNVHPQNTLQLADHLQAEGKPFYMMLYPNKTHSMSDAETRAHLFTVMTKFIEDNL